MKKFLLTGLCLTAIGFAQAQTVQEEERYDVNQYGVRVRTVPLEATAQNSILVLQNKKQRYKFWVDARVQFDMANYHNLKNGNIAKDNEARNTFSSPSNLNGVIPYADGKPVLPGGVSLRRVRLALKAEIDDWYGEVDMDLANGLFELQDAYVMYIGLKGFEFRAGNFKEDFSMERTSSSRYLMFMERAMAVSTFTPSRHAGLQANWIQFPWIRASAGISWQEISSWQQRNNVEEYNKDARRIGANYTGKIVLMPWGGSEESQGLHIGYAASRRSPYKVDDNVSAVGSGSAARGYQMGMLSARNTTTVNRTKFLRADEFGTLKHEFLQNLELAGYKNGARFQSEFIFNNSVMDKNKPGISSRGISTFDVENLNTKKFYGFYVQASYLLFGGKQCYNVMESEFTQPTRGRSWGDIEVMFRYDYLNLNSQGVTGGSGENYAFGVSYHVNDNVRLSLNYQISRNDTHANDRGRAAIGRTENGDWTNDYRLASNKFHRGTGFNAIQARIEIAF